MWNLALARKIANSKIIAGLTIEDWVLAFLLCMLALISWLYIPAS